MRVVFDTNVLVAAFAAEGLCAGLVMRANRKQFELFLSSFIRREFENTLHGKFGLSPDELKSALVLLDETAKAFDPANRNIRVNGVLRDKSDHAVLEAALACRAEFIVTGDHELLGLGEFRGIKIIAPREFELLFE